MRILKTRLRQVHSGLTAKERGRLILRAWKQDESEDPAWRSTLPSQERPEFNEYIGLMNAANGPALGYYIHSLRLTLERLNVLVDWLLWLQVSDLHLDELEHEASLLVREPITEGQYREKAKTDAYRHVGQLAALMVEDEHGWAAPEPEQAGGRLWKVIPYADSWQERYEEARERLHQAVLAGELEGQEEGGLLRIRGAAFEAWYGRRLCGKPEWGAGYDVRPDEQADRVASDRLVFEALRRSLMTMPIEHTPTKSLPVTAASIGGLAAGMREYLIEAVAQYWCWLRSIEIVVQLIGERFDGEDPLRPARRQVLEECREAIGKARRPLEAFGATITLSEPADEELEELLTVIGLSDDA